MSDDDRGQTTPLLAVIVVLGGVSALLIAQLGLRAIERAQAQTAADAAALAAAGGGQRAGVRLAEANGAASVDLVIGPGGAEVRVRRGSAWAVARAETDAEASLSPAMVAVLARAEAILGRAIRPISVSDDGRTVVVDPRDGADLEEQSESIGLCRLNSDSDLLGFEVCAWTRPT